MMPATVDRRSMLAAGATIDTCRSAFPRQGPALLTAADHRNRAELLVEARRLLGVDSQAAAQLARQALEMAQDATAAFVLGAAQRRDGDLAAALITLAPLAAALPGAWGVQYELGMVLAAYGRSDDAVVVLERAVRLNPLSSLAVQALGDQLVMIGRDVDAASMFGRLHDTVSDVPLASDIAAFLGAHDARAAGRLAARGLHPDDIGALRLFAEVGIRLGHLEASAALMAAVSAAAPAFMPARYAHAMALHRLERGQEALAAIDPVVAERPMATAGRSLRGAIRMQLGDAAGAIADYESVLAAIPDAAPAWHSYGHALKAIGRQPEAVRAYRRTIDLAPTLGEAWWSLANLKTLQFSADEIDRMTALVGEDISDDDRAYLSFALAKALEDRRDYPQSIAYYLKGNATRRAAKPYDAAAAHDLVQQTIATFSPDFLAARAGVGDSGADPIFIVGMPRSGSTLVEQILASHSAVEGASELPDMNAIARRLAAEAANADRSYPASLNDLATSEFAALGREYLLSTRSRRHSGRLFFVDKFPGNFLHTGLIHLVLPNARIIDVRRDPMGCCFSLFKQAFAQGQGYSYDLADLGRAYSDYVALMAHFDNVLPGRILKLSYEALVDDPDAQIRSLLDRLDLPFEHGCLHFFDTDRVIRTPSSEQVRQPIFRDGLDHWRNFEPWLGPLKAALGDHGITP